LFEHVCLRLLKFVQLQSQAYNSRLGFLGTPQYNTSIHCHKL